MFASMREGTVVDEERLNTGRGRDVEGTWKGRGRDVEGTWKGKM